MIFQFLKASVAAQEEQNVQKQTSQQVIKINNEKSENCCDFDGAFSNFIKNSSIYLRLKGAMEYARGDENNEKYLPKISGWSPRIGAKTSDHKYKLGIEFYIPRHSDISIGKSILKHVQFSGWVKICRNFALVLTSLKKFTETADKYKTIDESTDVHSQANELKNLELSKFGNFLFLGGEYNSYINFGAYLTWLGLVVKVNKQINHFFLNLLVGMNFANEECICMDNFKMISKLSLYFKTAINILFAYQYQKNSDLKHNLFTSCSINLLEIIYEFWRKLFLFDFNNIIKPFLVLQYHSVENFSIGITLAFGPIKFKVFWSKKYNGLVFVLCIDFKTQINTKTFLVN